VTRGRAAEGRGHEVGVEDERASCSPRSSDETGHRM
jgi:hypothetical protein